ncbi:membrane protease subunit HflK [Pseudoxanthomonas japonensis]|uniref:FtsH protease activity modulator HflK n=1 Tax=Pseudoxanthomonas TaxID=83618 RepID=UPI000784A3A9|nr:MULTISPECIES: FtsH protease activity modulator HflK [Pseudoxanthomonas]MBA3930575.1 FtsH protease activity modulator HflK [Xanthomonas sp.]MBL8257517.1 FtsH protease activity modulator HflK [Pseudoxanthomonas mexicana]MDR7069166.1 membrane protease subunit HflK [Pseudoxanthomonas japonensis]
MAWNTPGSGSGGSGNNGNRNNSWKPRNPQGGGGIGDVIERLRSLFGGVGGGGNPLRWVLLGIGLLVLFSSFQLIGEQDRGVVLRFGQYARTMQPGPNFKFPWPIESVTKVNATGVRTFSNSLPVLTRDENIITVSFNVQYRVGDPKLFLFGTTDATRVLEQTAQSAVREVIGRSDLDAALNNRGPLSATAGTALQASLEAYRTGLVVTELSLQDARPPEAVKPAFDEVNSAQQENERLVSQARAVAARIVPEARGDAQQIRTQAEGYKTASIAKATGDATRFSLLLDEYRNAPEVTRKRLWLDTVQQVLAGNRKVVGGDSRQLIYVPMGNAPATAQPPAGVIPTEVLPQVESTPSSSRNSARSPRPAGREEAQP